MKKSPKKQGKKLKNFPKKETPKIELKIEPKKEREKEASIEKISELINEKVSERNRKKINEFGSSEKFWKIEEPKKPAREGGTNARRQEPLEKIAEIEGRTEEKKEGKTQESRYSPVRRTLYTPTENALYNKTESNYQSGPKIDRVGGMMANQGIAKDYTASHSGEKSPDLWGQQPIRVERANATALNSWNPNQSPEKKYKEFRPE